MHPSIANSAEAELNRTHSLRPWQRLNTHGLKAPASLEGKTTLQKYAVGRKYSDVGVLPDHIHMFLSDSAVLSVDLSRLNAKTSMPRWTGRAPAVFGFRWTAFIARKSEGESRAMRRLFSSPALF